MPSAADLIFAAILGTLLLTPLSVKLLNDAGIGWHIRTGQQIIAEHAIPRTDPFSSQLRKPWTAWEWLYDVVVGQLNSTAGLNGVVWFTSVIIAGVFAATFWLLIRRGTDFLVALLLTLLAMSASMIHFLARPHVLSWLFALVWFWILESGEFEPRKNRRLWLLPALMLIWVNVHGGFVLGFVLLGVFWLGSAWTWLRLNEARLEEALEKIAAGKRTRDLTLVGLMSVLASLVNPYGWQLHAHIYSYLTDRFLMDHIDEFKSPDFHSIAPKCFLILLLIAVITLAGSGRRLGLSRFLVMLFAAYAGLYASRNIPIASILLVLIVGPLIPSVRLTQLSEKIATVDLSLRGHLWPIAATAVGLGVALNGGSIGSTQVMDAHFGLQRMPVQAVDFIERANIGDPVLSPDYWGGYVIYRLYPRNKVVIDDRHDFYGDSFLRSYLTAVHVEPGWEDFLKESSCLVLPTRAALTTMLGRIPEWKAIYSDDVAVVFTRTQILPHTD